MILKIIMPETKKPLSVSRKLKNSPVIPETAKPLSGIQEIKKQIPDKRYTFSGMTTLPSYRKRRSRYPVSRKLTIDSG